MDDPILQDLEGIVGQETIKDGKSKYQKRIAFTILLVLGIGIGLDFALQPCVKTESEEDRIVRLICENRTMHDELIEPLYSIVNASAINEVCSLVEDTEWWLSYNPKSGIFLTALLYTVLTLLFIPGSLLAIGAGAAFTGALGIVKGTLAATFSVWLGAMIGALLAFYTGRFFFRSKVEVMTEKYVWLRAVDRSMQTHGLKLMFLLRLSPAIPFNVFNYVMGCTAVSWKYFLFGSAAGIVPGALAYVLLGGALSSAIDGSNSGDADSDIMCAGGESEEGDSIQMILSIVGGIATFLAVLILTVVSKREINRILEEESKTSQDSDLSASVASIRPVMNDDIIGVLPDDKEDDPSTESRMAHSL